MNKWKPYYYRTLGHTHTHARTHTHAYTHTHEHSHTLTQTHTHTHKRGYLFRNSTNVTIKPK